MVRGHEGLGKLIRQPPCDCGSLVTKCGRPSCNPRLKNNSYVMNHVSFRVFDDLEVARLAIDADQPPRLDCVTGLLPHLSYDRGRDTLARFHSSSGEAPVAVVAALLQQETILIIPHDSRDRNSQLIDLDSGGVWI